MTCTKATGAHLRSGLANSKTVWRGSRVSFRSNVHSDARADLLQFNRAALTVVSNLTEERLRDYANVLASRSIGTAEASARATALLAREVRRQAYVLSFIDGFMVLGYPVFVALLLILFYATRRRNPPL
jgi:hypothetical protein